jgi:hypothetical protein
VRAAYNCCTDVSVSVCYNKQITSGDSCYCYSLHANAARTFVYVYTFTLHTIQQTAGMQHANRHSSSGSNGGVSRGLNIGFRGPLPASDLLVRPSLILSIVCNLQPIVCSGCRKQILLDSLLPVYHSTSGVLCS